MAQRIGEVKAKILEMYPDIEKFGVQSAVTYDQQKDTYILELRKDEHHLSTFIDREDADKCLNNIECIHLGVQIGQFLENFKKV
jgi:phosphoenolpyruvate carboxylase